MRCWRRSSLGVRHDAGWLFEGPAGGARVSCESSAIAAAKTRPQTAAESQTGPRKHSTAL